MTKIIDLQIRICIALTAILLFSFPVDCIAAPKGSVRLPANLIFRSGPVVCGFVKGQFVPGRILKDSLFYSRVAERKNILAKAKSASGVKKKQLEKQAKSLLSKHKTELRVCNRGPVSATPTATAQPEQTSPPPAATATPSPTSRPIILNNLGAGVFNTEHALFIIPDPSAVSFEGPASRDSVYSTSNIDSYVATLKSHFPADYFFVTVTANDLLPSRAPNVLTYRAIANGIGQDSITGVNVPNICRYQGSGQVIDGTYGVLDHEIGHNWSVFIGSELGEGHWRSNSNASGQMAETYSDDGGVTIKQISGDPMTGFTWQGIDNFLKNETETFDDRDLYLQGLAATFPALHVLDTPIYNSNGTVSYSSVATYDQSWVEARNGVRSPSYRTSPKRFSIATIYVARDDNEVQTVYQAVERSARQFASEDAIDTIRFRFQVPFLVATKYRGSVDGLLADLDGNQTPTISIVGSDYAVSSNGSASFTFNASDTDGTAPTVSCVPLSATCSVSGSTVNLSSLAVGSHFFTLKAQDAGGKKSYTHFVVDVTT